MNYQWVTLIFLADSNLLLIWDKIEEDEITTSLLFQAVYSYMLDELNKKDVNYPLKYTKRWYKSARKLIQK